MGNSGDGLFKKIIFLFIFNIFIIAFAMLIILYFLPFEIFNNKEVEYFPSLGIAPWDPKTIRFNGQNFS